MKAIISRFGPMIGRAMGPLAAPRGWKLRRRRVRDSLHLTGGQHPSAREWAGLRGSAGGSVASLSRIWARLPSDRNILGSAPLFGCDLQDDRALLQSGDRAVLTAIGFIAFPARAFAERLEDPAARQTGAVFFVFGLFLTSLTWLIKWTVGRKSGHVDDRLEVSYVDRLDRRYRVSAAVTAAAAVTALFWWQAGLFVGMLALLTYMLPPETPKYRSIAPTVEGES